MGHTYLYLTGFLGSRQQGREKYKGKSKGERERERKREISDRNLQGCEATAATSARDSRGRGSRRPQEGPLPPHRAGATFAWERSLERREQGEEETPSFAGMLHFYVELKDEFSSSWGFSCISSLPAGKADGRQASGAALEPRGTAGHTETEAQRGQNHSP